MPDAVVLDCGCSFMLFLTLCEISVDGTVIVVTMQLWIAWSEELGILKTLGLKKVLEHEKPVIGWFVFPGGVPFPTFFQNSLLLMAFLSLLHYVRLWSLFGEKEQHYRDVGKLNGKILGFPRILLLMLFAFELPNPIEDKLQDFSCCSYEQQEIGNINTVSNPPPSLLCFKLRRPLFLQIFLSKRYEFLVFQRVRCLGLCWDFSFSTMHGFWPQKQRSCSEMGSTWSNSSCPKDCCNGGLAIPVGVGTCTFHDI
ncbi:unnamed protein product [Sphenostylis stenocarpa]|uniref:Uncharacterized protein n=1 Tax=Sphenostylis stenocarpa TaxID=92480 RepID=A0AA86T6B5_9FABA|nr:unnamed protein product [Sphenostylis stenocarpa]